MSNSKSEFISVSKLLSTLMGAFIFLILFGAVFLSITQKMSILEALFTATSIVTLNGQEVVSVAEFDSAGQVLVLIFTQLSGMLIVSFSLISTWLIFFNLRNASLESWNKPLWNGLKKVALISLSIELLLTIAVFFAWNKKQVFNSGSEKLFYSAFHVVSAFYNSGLSLFAENLAESTVKITYFIHLILSAGMILGGVGFLVLEDIFSVKKMRNRLKHPAHDWHLTTKVTLYFYLFLLILGTIGLYLLEKENTFKNLKLMEAFIESYFHSVSARTTGFFTFDLSQLNDSTIIFLLVLMFIGASPTSAGGGIKTTVIIVLFAGLYRRISSKREISIGGKSIDSRIYSIASSVFVVAFLFNSFCLGLLVVFEPEVRFLDLIFEQISAFSLVGFSKVQLKDFSAISQSVLMFSMLTGRFVLPLYLIFLSNKMRLKSAEPAAATLVLIG